jgi:hypothetical protein
MFLTVLPDSQLQLTIVARSGVKQKVFYEHVKIRVDFSLTYRDEGVQFTKFFTKLAELRLKKSIFLHKLK